MNTVRVTLSPEDIVRNIKGLPQGGLILQTSIRAIGSTFEFQYHHPEIQHPFEVMELRAYLKARGERSAEPVAVAPVSSEPTPETPAAPAPAEDPAPTMTEAADKPKRKR